MYDLIGYDGGPLIDENVGIFFEAIYSRTLWSVAGLQAASQLLVLRNDYCGSCMGDLRLRKLVTSKTRSSHINDLA